MSEYVNVCVCVCARARSVGVFDYADGERKEVSFVLGLFIYYNCVQFCALFDFHLSPMHSLDVVCVCMCV